MMVRHILPASGTDYVFTIGGGPAFLCSECLMVTRARRTDEPRSCEVVPCGSSAEGLTPRSLLALKSTYRERMGRTPFGVMNGRPPATAVSVLAGKDGDKSGLIIRLGSRTFAS